MSKRANQNRKWEATLKREWATKGINYCELRFPDCMGTFGLALAHSKKRRYIYTKSDYWSVVLACQKCHEVLDLRMSHEDMETTVKEIIESR